MTTEWVKGIILKEKASPGMMAIQTLGDGKVLVVPRHTNQRACDEGDGVKEFELTTEGREE